MRLWIHFARVVVSSVVCRHRLIPSVLVAAAALAPAWAEDETVAARSAAPRVDVRTLTSGPKHHFFGYYGINPWNASGQRLVCLETGFQDHVPSPDEPAAICLVDATTGDTTKVAETRAWNFQQGAMLHWDPQRPEDRLFYNDRRGRAVIAVALDTRTGEKQDLPRAISAVSHDGRHALSLTYGRLQRLRPVVGYRGVPDPNRTVPNPDNDGVFLMDLATGDARLVVSIATVYDLLVRKYPELEGNHMWFNHTVFNSDDTRFLFLARAKVVRRGQRTAMLTANLDGSDLREVVPLGLGVSHFGWRDARTIIATFRPPGGVMGHVLFSDGQTDYRVLGPDRLVGNGHCTFGPDGDWLVSDPRVTGTKSRALQLYNVATEDGAELGVFPLGKYASGDLRCDLHPRWNATGDAICFDAIEPAHGTRQLHVAEIRWPSTAQAP